MTTYPYFTPYPVGRIPEGVQRLQDQPEAQGRRDRRLYLDVGLDPRGYVTDRLSGWTFEILRDQPCGLGCRCAATARWVQHIPREEVERVNAWPESDTVLCVETGEHDDDAQHPLAECPTAGGDEG